MLSRSVSSVTANELAVLRECHVALDDARALTRTGLIRLFRVLRELQRRSAVCNHEIAATERAVLAALQLLLEPAVVHALD